MMGIPIKINELVKSHIPYVVYASTKPVLSSPFVPSRASGRTVFPNVLSEVEGQAHGERFFRMS
jgi:hypothetical protein